MFKKSIYHSDTIADSRSEVVSHLHWHWAPFACCNRQRRPWKYWASQTFLYLPAYLRILSGPLIISLILTLKPRSAHMFPTLFRAPARRQASASQHLQRFFTFLPQVHGRHRRLPRAPRLRLRRLHALPVGTRRQQGAQSAHDRPSTADKPGEQSSRKEKGELSLYHFVARKIDSS